MSGNTSTTNFFLTDGSGSVLGVFSNTAGSAVLLSTQLFTPYGTQLVANGNSIGQYTTKGFTGQYSDSVSGLDYYVSRYYDPVAGVFLSADKVQGNVTAMNPYSYVGNNPETFNDPTGSMYVNPGSAGGGGGNNQSSQNTSQSGCAWYDIGCNFVQGVQEVWNWTTQDVTSTWHATVHNFQTDTQSAWNGTIHDLRSAWNSTEQGVQQAGQIGEFAVRALWKGIVKIVVAVLAAVAAAALAYFTWQARSSSWNLSQQRKVAYKLAQNIDQFRRTHNRNQRGTYAQGCIALGASTSCDSTSQPVLGTGYNGNYNHAENKIFRWALGEITNNYQNLALGTTINVMIYVQQIPCPPYCQNDIPLWAKALQAAAPQGVKVNLYVWYQPSFDKNNPFGNPITSPNDVAPYRS